MKAAGAAGYEISYSTKVNSGYKVSKSVSALNSSYQVTGLTPGKTYYFRVRPYNSAKTYGNYTASVSAKTNNVGKATNAKKSTVKKTSVKLKWTKRTDVTGYKIYRSMNKKSGYKLVKTVKAKATSFTNKKLSRKKTYYYKIVPYVKSGKKTYNGKATIIKVKTK